MLTLLFVAGTSFSDRLIRLAQRCRYHGADAHYATWTHVALLLPDGASLIESAGRHGIRRNTRAAYASLTTVVGSVECAPDEAAAALTYADSCLGESYGWLSIATVGLALITAGSLNLTNSRTMDCSEFCAHVLEHAGVILDRDPAQTCPADLAKRRGVSP